MQQSDSTMTNVGTNMPVPGDNTAALGREFNSAAIVEGIRQLYMCKPTDTLLKQLYTDDAIFEDPAGKLSPVLAFKGLAELFEPFEVEKFEAIETTPSLIRIDLAMTYKTRPLGIKLPFKAEINAKLNEQGKIYHHMDYWSGSPLMHSSDGFLGKCAEVRRRLTGLMQEGFVKVTGGTKIGADNSAAASAPKQPMQ